MSLKADEFLQTLDSQARKAATAYIYLDSKLLAHIVLFPDSPDFENLPDFRTGRDVRWSPNHN